MPGQRGYELRLLKRLPPQSVTFGGQIVPYNPEGGSPGWTYDGENLTTIISLPQTPVSKAIDVVVEEPPATPAQQALLNGFAGTLSRVKDAMEMINHQWPKEWSPDLLVGAAQTGNRITLAPFNALDELSRFAGAVKAMPDAVGKLAIDPEVKRKVLNHLLQGNP